ncbi:hypothetical protein JAAARDRAFT_29544 [Jaapia argillacea MUCL 33604]|uniref:Carbohydrate kinase PfkB domain-containing protein n=1 Tax=Jaapia argillacea MUCL 33604 TaxID=933084 RepID=A0A067QBJ3_9AGAM|nr:hypothetical protein JAAARDRAFT_29544 [Jaapia argillacea MUCL 33604]
MALPRLPRSLPSSLVKSLQRNAPIDIHPQIHHALLTHAPLVALESTIITHGMPYPTNLSTALSVERIVRETGSTPATIAIIGGRIKIGLEQPELERLAESAGKAEREGGAVKVSRRDIACAVAMRKDGGTTCSTTLILAALAGIKVFATGGLGGVHRGAENSMDISADLPELTRCPVGLVSAGVKSILDIGRTLEYLETLGVPVISYSETKDFPAFYSPRSGFQSPWNTTSPSTAAQILFTHFQLSLQTGALFGVPIPSQYEHTGSIIQAAVEQAITESEKNGMSKRGKEVTPWLLKRVGELTSGKSLESNVALIENTARVGGEIAAEYAKLEREYRESISSTTPHPAYPPPTPPTPNQPQPQPSAPLPPAKLAIIGASAIDITSKSLLLPNPSQGHATTSPGTVSLSLGGVARNIAEASHRCLNGSEGLNGAVMLVSPVGGDAFGRLVLEESGREGMRVDGFVRGVGGERSAVCNMVLDGDGGLVGGVADMDIVYGLRGDVVVQRLEKQEPVVVAFDGNLSPKTIEDVVKYSIQHNISTFFEPTSITKSTSILPAISSCLSLPSHSAPITYASPNLLELTHLFHTAQSEPFELTSHDTWWRTIDSFALSSEFRRDLEHLSKRKVNDNAHCVETLGFLIEDGVAQMAVNLLPFFQNLVVKLGPRGVLVVLRVSGEDVKKSGWAGERSNPRGRYIVARGQDDLEMVVIRHFPALSVSPDEIVSVTGAGDTLVGSLLASLVLDPTAFHHPKRLDDVIERAQQAAVMTLKSNLAVSPFIVE